MFNPSLNHDFFLEENMTAANTLIERLCCWKLQDAGQDKKLQSPIAPQVHVIRLHITTAVVENFRNLQL